MSRKKSTKKKLSSVWSKIRTYLAKCLRIYCGLSENRRFSVQSPPTSLGSAGRNSIPNRIAPVTIRVRSDEKIEKLKSEGSFLRKPWVAFCCHFQPDVPRRHLRFNDLSESRVRLEEKLKNCLLMAVYCQTWRSPSANGKDAFFHFVLRVSRSSAGFALFLEEIVFCVCSSNL